MAFNLEYLAAGGNLNPSAADHDTVDQVLAFGCGQNVALWQVNNPSCQGINAIYKECRQNVSAVKFLYTQNQERHLVCGSTDGNLSLWRSIPGRDFPAFEHCTVIQGHSASVDCLATNAQVPGILVSGSADGNVCIWRIERGDSSTSLVLLQRLTPEKQRLLLAVAITRCSDDSILLAFGGSGNDISLYTSTSQDPFIFQCTLKGHEGWIRSLDFTIERQDNPEKKEKEPNFASSGLLLASASQDKFVRLWRIRTLPPPDVEPSLQQSNGSIQPIRNMSNRIHQMKVGALDFTATFEALLAGHDDWVYSVRWSPESGTNTLLSASADNSLAIWTMDTDSGIWIIDHRLGELSLQKGSTSATGSMGGLWNGLWVEKANTVLGLGRNGSWLKWHQPMEGSSWIQKTGLTGHTRPVRGLSWAEDGSYLLSVSADQTTRLHAEWKRSKILSWHEFSRPQIHGYDLNCVASLTTQSFISGADEKLLRVFEEPDSVATTLHELSNAPRQNTRNVQNAELPVLGLSNKAVERSEKDPNDVSPSEAIESNATQISSSAANIYEPPNEDQLAKFSLWPENEKLYGHGFEVNQVAVSPDAKYIATSCRASSTEHAVIRLFFGNDFRQLKPPLTGHSLSVTGMQFSEDSKLLLSVGRDRQWLVWKHSTDDNENTSFSMFSRQEKAHNKMILSTTWLQGLSQLHNFATGGRDKLLKIWSLSADAVSQCIQTIDLIVPAVSMAISPPNLSGDAFLALGGDAGQLRLCSYKSSTGNVQELDYLPTDLCPSAAINDLSWRPVATGETKASQTPKLQLAVASEDNTVRILSVVP